MPSEDVDYGSELSGKAEAENIRNTNIQSRLREVWRRLNSYDSYTSVMVTI